MDSIVAAVIHGIFIGALYAVVAFGLALVHSISGVLNFAHGYFVVVSMYLTLILNSALGIDPYLSAIFIIPVMFGIGGLMYQLIFKRLTGAHILTVIQATLGVMFIIQSLLLMTQGGQYRRVPSVVDGRTLSLGPIHVEFADLIGFVAAVALAGLLFWLLGRTGFGRNVRSVHQNPRGAQLMGVNITRVRVVSFGLGIALASVAGVLLVPGNSLHPTEGLGFTVIAIMAFFLGGVGNFLGTFVGALVLGVAESVGAVYLPGAIGFTLPYVIVVLAIIFRPHGLFAGGVKR